MNKKILLLTIFQVMVTPIVPALAASEQVKIKQRQQFLKDFPNPVDFWGILKMVDGVYIIQSDAETHSIDKAQIGKVLAKCKVGTLCEISGWSGAVGDECEGIHGTCSSFWKLRSVIQR